MKTTINTLKNSARQFRNQILRIGAMVTSLMICSFVLFAQNDLQQLFSYKGMNEMTSIIDNENENGEPGALSAKAIGFELSEESDRALDVESWMTDAGFFTTFNLTDEAEPGLEVESWMSSDIYFSNYLVEEKESELNVESWMTSDFYFQNYRVEEKDPELTIECWMTDESFWTGK